MDLSLALFVVLGVAVLVILLAYVWPRGIQSEVLDVRLERVAFAPDGRLSFIPGAPLVLITIDVRLDNLNPITVVYSPAKIRIFYKMDQLAEIDVAPDPQGPYSSQVTQLRCVFDPAKAASQHGLEILADFWRQRLELTAESQIRAQARLCSVPLKTLQVCLHCRVVTDPLQMEVMEQDVHYEADPLLFSS